jgi:hypothetical protein
MDKIAFEAGIDEFIKEAGKAKAAAKAARRARSYTIKLWPKLTKAERRANRNRALGLAALGVAGAGASYGMSKTDAAIEHPWGVGIPSAMVGGALPFIAGRHTGKQGKKVRQYNYIKETQGPLAAKKYLADMD